MEMKKENFKEITPKHIKIVKRIVKKGKCDGIICGDCPFSVQNYIHNKMCSSVDFVSKDAKQFLELFDTEPKSLNFYERLSATLYNKQVLFKQDDGSYYNRSLDVDMSKSEVKEWLLAEVEEVCKDD